jgi:hypothetical protein
MPLTDQELAQLRRAKQLLETPGLAARVTDLVGRPLERTVAVLPARAVEQIHQIARTALERGLEFALATMGPGSGRSADRLHALATATTGAVGGFFGLAGLAVELPATTVIMLRSIGDIARSEGHDLASPEVRLACLEVFALGGSSASDDAAETGYYTVRAAMAKLVSDAVNHLAEHGLARTSTPALVRLLERIAARFGIVVQEKAALELVPVVGALSGALINTLFMHHFQSTARGHFIVKRLESVHGMDAVREAYRAL